MLILADGLPGCALSTDLERLARRIIASGSPREQLTEYQTLRQVRPIQPIFIRYPGRSCRILGEIGQLRKLSVRILECV